MTITPIKAFQDNYIWMIQDGVHTLCVDPGDFLPVLEHLRHRRLALEGILVTHLHHDHTGGIPALKRVYRQMPVYGGSDIPEATHRISSGMQIPFGSGTITVWATPGHTAHHVSYLLENSDGLHVFCGDTLFSAGCGRIFTGTAEQLFDSFERFNRLPEQTLFYPAHEYTAANLRFAAHIEPDNPDIQTALSAAASGATTLPVTLGHERKVNPFLRIGLPHVWQRTEQLSGRTFANELEAFAALRELKNRF